MFTGIIQDVAQLITIEKHSAFQTHTIKMPTELLVDLKTGASVAHDGCCLTVTKIQGDLVSFDVIEETLRVTNLDALVPGDWVNIERSVKFGDEVGGHVMSGHIMTTAEICRVVQSEQQRTMWFKLKDAITIKYLFHKGYVGINGISLTVGEVTKEKFCVHLIPETLQRTTLGRKKIGQCVNIEVDAQTQAIVETVERTLGLMKYHG